MKRALGISAAVAAVLAAGSICYTAWLAREAYSRFESRNFAGAWSAWSQLEKAPGWEAAAEYNMGVSRCRMGNYSAAAGHFRRSCRTGDSVLRSRALYNLGTALIHVASASGTVSGPAEAGRLQDAASSLQQCLALAPSDEAAAANLKIAQTRLLALSGEAKPQHKKSPPQSQPQTQESVKDEKRKERDDQRAAKPGKATDLDQEGAKKRRAGVDRNHALRMLDEARGREALGSATAASTATTRLTPPEKDW